MATILKTSNIIWQSVNLTDELKINLEYDIHRSLLNIIVKNNKLPCYINVLSNQSEEFELISDNESKIYYEISTTYVYDIIDENENIEQIDFSQTLIPSSLSSSSSFFSDEQIMDNDDGYSTHSLDDIEQQQLLAIPSSKLIIPSFLSQHHYSEQYVSPIRRLIEQLTWLSPFKNMVQEMMMNHMFY